MLREVIINVPIVLESAMKLVKFFLFFIRKSFQNAFSCVLFICMENICIPGPFFKLLKFVKIIKYFQNFHRINNPNSLNSLCIVTAQQQCEHNKFFSIHFEFLKYFMGRKILNVIIKDSSKNISSSEQENIWIFCYNPVDQLVLLKTRTLGLCLRSCLNVRNADHFKKLLEFNVSVILWIQMAYQQILVVNEIGKIVWIVSDLCGMGIILAFNILIMVLVNFVCLYSPDFLADQRVLQKVI